jgi:hypothetical protein
MISVALLGTDKEGVIVPVLTLQADDMIANKKLIIDENGVLVLKFIKQEASLLSVNAVGEVCLYIYIYKYIYVFKIIFIYMFIFLYFNIHRCICI